MNINIPKILSSFQCSKHSRGSENLIESSTATNSSDLLNDPQGKFVRNKFRYRLFLVTNEIGQEIIFNRLQNEKVRDNTAIGTSGFEILNQVSIRGSTSKASKRVEYIIVIDRSNKVAKFWKKMAKIIVNSTKVEEAISKITFLIKCNVKRFFGYFEPFKHADIALKCLELEIRSGISWLSNGGRYHIIRDIFLKNHFGFAFADFCDENAMKSLAKIMLQNGLGVDSLYLSNIREYVEMEEGTTGLKKFRNAIQNLRSVITDDSLVVQTEPREFGSYNKFCISSMPKPKQTIEVGIKTADLKKWFPASDGLERVMKLYQIFSSIEKETFNIIKFPLNYTYTDEKGEIIPINQNKIDKLYNMATQLKVK